MSTHIDYTEDDVRTFAPFCKAFYRDVLLSSEGRAALAEAGILDNGRRLSHFLGQVGAETGGLTIRRESLNYTTVKRIKEVWPARSRAATEAEMQALVRNPVALGDWAYGGRMGNGKGTISKPNRDGYAFRGGGWIQTTGREAVERYCRKLGITAPYIVSGALDNPLLTLKFACLEWQEGGCNEYADADDIMRISKRINVGNANSAVTPNGMDDRRQWTAKAKKLWWDAKPVEVPAPSVASTGRTVIAEAEADETGQKTGQPDTVAPPEPTVAATEMTVAEADKKAALKVAVHKSRTIFGALSTLGAVIASIFQEPVQIVIDALGQFELISPAMKLAIALGFTTERFLYAAAIASIALVIYAKIDDVLKGHVVK